MTEQPSGHLKIFPAQASAEDPHCEPDYPWLGAFFDAFSQLGGWQLGREPDPQRDITWSNEQAATPLFLQPQPRSGKQPRLNREQAVPLAENFGLALAELDQTRAALRAREAELAAGIPVGERADEPAELARRLEAALQAGVQAVGCASAGLYMLDDATSELKLRASWGLPGTRLLEPARPLQGALADLEALIGHAVVLDETSLLPSWKPPEAFPSSVCVPISSPSTPLGTVWFFAEEQRTFSDEQVNVIEVVAGRLSADLERHVLLKSGVATRRWERETDRAAQWLDNRLPQVTPLLDDWELAAWCASSQRLGGDFYDWMILPTGELALAVGSAVGSPWEAALTSALLQAAVKAHAQHRHSPRKLVAEVNETLCSSSAGDQFASLIYAVINTETGELRYSYSGENHLQVVGQAVEADERSVPLLGTEPDLDFPEHSLQIEPGQIALLAGRGLLRSERAEWLESEARRMGDTAGPREFIDVVRHRLLTSKPDGGGSDATLLVVQRDHLKGTTANRAR